MLMLAFRGGVGGQFPTTYKDPRHFFKADLKDLELVSYQPFFLCCLWMTVPAFLTSLVQYRKILPNLYQPFC